MVCCCEKLKNLRPVDYVIIAAVAFVIIIGLLVVFGKNKFSKSPVEATKKIAFQVTMRSISITDRLTPFRIGEDAFITIRNVPYTKLQIIDAQIMPKSIVVPTPGGKTPFIVTEDKSQPNLYDAVVTLIDEAKITNDGPVVGGNKIKIGVPIVLEGFNYRIGGTISNVEVLNDFDLMAIHQHVENHKIMWKREKEKIEAKSMEKYQKEAESLKKAIK